MIDMAVFGTVHMKTNSVLTTDTCRCVTGIAIR